MYINNQIQPTWPNTFILNNSKHDIPRRCLNGLWLDNLFNGTGPVLFCVALG